MSTDEEGEPRRASSSARDPHPLPFQIALAGIGGLALVLAAFLLLRHPSHASALLGPFGGWALGSALRFARARMHRRAYRTWGTVLGSALLVAGVIAAMTVSWTAWFIAVSGLALILAVLLDLPRDRATSALRRTDAPS